MIKAVVFDMDGVLIDARDWHYEALNRALEVFGFTIGRLEHIELFDGLPTKKKLELLSAERGLPEGLHVFINELKQEFTTQLTMIRCRPTFIHQFALAELKRQGFLLGVASNSIRETIDAMMKRSRLDQYLDCTVSAEDVRCPKPDPDIYLRIMAELGVSPEETLIVEDSQHGIKSAIAAGGHVMPVKDVTDVTIQNIQDHLSRIEMGKP